MVSRAGLEVLSSQLLPPASFSRFGAKEDIGYTIREHVVLKRKRPYQMETVPWCLQLREGVSCSTVSVSFIVLKKTEIISSRLSEVIKFVNEMPVV